MMPLSNTILNCSYYTPESLVKVSLSQRIHGEYVKSHLILLPLSQDNVMSSNPLCALVYLALPFHFRHLLLITLFLLASTNPRLIPFHRVHAEPPAWHYLQVVFIQKRNEAWTAVLSSCINSLLHKSEGIRVYTQQQPTKLRILV